MANNCGSKYVFYPLTGNKGNDSVRQLWEDLNVIYNGSCGPCSLKEVLAYFGYPESKAKWRDTLIKLYEIQENNGAAYFYLDTETAWVPKPEVWDVVLEKFPELGYDYIAEEPGMGIFVNTDKDGRFFKDRFRMEIYLDTVEPSDIAKLRQILKAEGFNPDLYKENTIRNFTEVEELLEFAALKTGRKVHDYTALEKLADYTSSLYDGGSVVVAMYDYGL